MELKSKLQEAAALIVLLKTEVKRNKIESENNFDKFVLIQMEKERLESKNSFIK